MPDSNEAEMIHIANEIKRYIKDYPNAADTLEGIAKWWLLRQRYEESVSLVQEALDYLVLESVVERKTNIGGDHVYFSAKRPGNGEK